MLIVEILKKIIYFILAVAHDLTAQFYLFSNCYHKFSTIKPLNVILLFDMQIILKTQLICKFTAAYVNH